MKMPAWTLNVWFFLTAGNLLSKSDIRILKIALAEHLLKLKDSGLDLNRNDDPYITKEEVVMYLREIDNRFAKILSERGRALSSINVDKVVR